jgi:subtilisin-like proprotein convertase family protein
MSHRLDIIHVMNNSWGAEDCDSPSSAVLMGAGPLMRAAIRNGVDTGRGGKGVVYVWAGGNGRNCGDDVNYDGFANLVDVIAVGAVTSTGAPANYSEPGACLIAVAPSDGGGQAITTTDLSGNAGYNSAASSDLQDRSYTSTFTGTSAATPMVSGVVALLLEANPELGHRDVKEILLRSGTRVQPLDSDWQTNSSGIVHNHRFGGGLVNAMSAITLGTNWLPLAPRSEVALSATNLATPIPDADDIGINYKFTVTNQGARVENVALTFTAPHSRWGDLAVTLTSPAGSRSRLATPHTGDPSYTYDAWTFNTVRHWGEHAFGDWTITVADHFFSYSGVLDALDLNLYVSTPIATLTLEPSSLQGTNTPTLNLVAPAPGWRYAIDVAEELGGSPAWTELAVVTIPTSGRVTVPDPIEAALPGQRFYRARLVE